MSVSKGRPNVVCTMCGKTLAGYAGKYPPLWVVYEQHKEGLCNKCYNKRGRDKMFGKDPYRRRK